MQKFSLGTNLCGEATPTKIKPTKYCSHEELATVITVGFSHPQKFIPLKILPTKYCDNENFYVYGIGLVQKLFNTKISRRKLKKRKRLKYGTQILYPSTSSNMVKMDLSPL